MFVLVSLLGLMCNINCQEYESYNRSVLQKKYPGYGTEYIFFPDPDGKPMKVYLKDPSHQANYRTGFGLNNLERDVTFTFYSRQLPGGYPLQSLEQIYSFFDKNKPTKFITHGWMSSGKADTCITIKDGFLHKYDANVFIMDWSAIANNFFYPIPMRATTKIGKLYGSFIQSLIDNLAVHPNDIHLVGHSLGAHVSGFAGRRVKTDKIGRITGLDPALPGFDVGIVDGGRLNKKDALFVDVIHTCAGFLGYRLPIGHIDFYPNGGTPPQPGCNILEFIEPCSHGRSWKLFAASLKFQVPYMATKCDGWIDLLDKKCDGSIQIEMGDPTPHDATGVYYIKTTSDKPYIKSFRENGV